VENDRFFLFHSIAFPCLGEVAAYPTLVTLRLPARRQAVPTRSLVSRMDIPGPTTLVGTRTDYSVGPWDYSTCVARHLMAWSARTTVEKYSDRKLCMSGSM
jgi:hypothetical protein